MSGTVDTFSELYHYGERLDLMRDGEKLTDAIVTTFDPTTSKGGPNEGSKAARQTPDHWHVLLREPETDEWLPAAIYESSYGDRPTYLDAHFRFEHFRAEDINQGKIEDGEEPNYLAFSTEELRRRVLNIAFAYTEIVPVKE